MALHMQASISNGASAMSCLCWVIPWCSQFWVKSPSCQCWSWQQDFVLRYLTIWLPHALASSECCTTSRPGVDVLLTHALLVLAAPVISFVHSVASVHVMLCVCATYCSYILHHATAECTQCLLCLYAAKVQQPCSHYRVSHGGLAVVAQGVEATLFATLMSVLNGGAFAGSTLGALLTKSFGVTSEDFTHLAPLVTVCTLSSLLPLPLLRLLPQGSTTDQIQSSNDKESESA